MSYEDKAEKEEWLQTSFMGDIREDIQFMGLTVTDFIWIVGTTLLLGGLPFLFPLSFLVKMVWFAGVFLGIFMSRLIKWPYLRKRLMRYFRSKKEEGGKELASLLGMKEDGWLYRNGKRWEMIFSVQAPPWETAVSDDKRRRINSFGSFIRTAMNEGFSVDIQSEQIPDYRYEWWDQKASRPAASEGIERLKQNRIHAWQETVHRGEAFRSEYIISLSISEFDLNSHQRDDEPADASKEEIRRFRILAELRERMERVTDQLKRSGHSFTLLSGYASVELIARYWDRKAWMQWMEARGTWDEVEESPELEPHGTEQKDEQAAEESKTKRKWWKRERTADIEAEPAVRSNEALSELKTPLEVAKPDLESVDLPKSPKALEWLIEALKTVSKIVLRGMKGFRRKPKVDQPLEVAAETKEAQAEENMEIPLPAVLLLTSPASSGQTFLAANVAVAYSSLESPVTLLDLSPDRGTLTVINPIRQEEDDNGMWWASRNVPGLAVWTAAEGSYPTIQHLKELIQTYKPHGPVIVDLPWHHPGREELLKEGVAAAIVDSDYHHWLQWEKQPKGWDGEVWLNQNEMDMQKLVEEHLQAPVTRRFPTFSEARRQLYQGRPLALEREQAICFRGGVAHASGGNKAS